MIINGPFIFSFIFSFCLNDSSSVSFRFPADFDVGEVSAYNIWQLFIRDLNDFLEGNSAW